MWHLCIAHFVHAYAHTYTHTQYYYIYTYTYIGAVQERNRHAQRGGEPGAFPRQGCRGPGGVVQGRYVLCVYVYYHCCIIVIIYKPYLPSYTHAISHKPVSIPIPILILRMPRTSCLWRHRV
ncbi:hypothetical protein EON63_03170 [archaeon]|nr:MAG: hypothetical protein EON63_03170 [archaeon]